MRARWMFLVLLAVPGMLQAAGRTARLSEPKGRIAETSPTFTWSAVETATQYDLWVVGQGGPQITESIAPADGCVDGRCSFAATEPLTPGPYLWIVMSRIPGGLDRWSSPRRFTVSPDGLRPGKVELVAPAGELDTTTPTFTWRTAGDGMDYELVVQGGRPRTLFRQVYSGATICESGLCTAPPALTDLMLADGRHRWTVRASGIGGRGPRSDRMRFDVRTLPRPPERPTLVSPNGRSSETSPTFVWNTAARAAEYYLEIRRHGVEVHAQWYAADATLCPDTTCSITPTGLVLENGRYRFKVTAKNAAGSGRPSRSMRFRIGDFLDKPVAVAPEGMTSTQPTFQWYPVADATHYMVRLRQDRVRVATTRFAAASVCDPALCSADLGVDLPEGTYKWSVIARSDIRRSSSPSDWMIFEAKAGGGSPPVAPDLIAPDGTIDTKTPTFKWTEVSGATTYKLTVKDAFDPVLYSHTYSSDVACTPTDGCMVTPTEMLENGDYSFTVEAINPAGSSPPSAAKNFKVMVGGGVTPPGIPELIGPTGTVTTGVPTFMWRPVTMATAYVLMVKDAVDPLVYTYEYGTDVCAVECTATPPDILADGNYTFFVTAKKGDVSGEPGRGEFIVDTSPAPPATTPLSPMGRITETHPAFSWTVVTEAVAYTLVVVDSGGLERHNARYLPSDLTCDVDRCMVTPSPSLDLEDGSYSFTVTTENAAAMMTTSDVLVFTVATTPSNLRVTSHTDGETLTDGGQIISGTVDAATVSLTAELTIDGATVMAARAVEISTNDAWSVFLLPGQLSPGAAVLTLISTEGGGATSTMAFNFTLAALDLKQAPLLSRATFGTTPALREEIRSGGATAFQDRLLNPVPDPAFDAFVASLPTTTDDEVREYALMHALFNPNALQEVMTQFWDNHFSTDMGSHDVAEFELRENNDFRANAFGRFRDLLEISAKSPAMLNYLDLTNNSLVEPNENYAREILELSTLGVDQGYTQTDIEELARILTGWKEVGGNFAFVASDHDTGTKTFLGVTFPTPAGSGLVEGEVVLDMLSEHRSTAEFLCTKLAEVFITENPGAFLVNGCADVFQAGHASGNPNQMRDVVQFLLDAPEFADPANFHAKVKTPLELVASTVRHLDATVEDRRDLERDLDRDLDMELFGHRSPDGFSETADDWIDTSLLLARVNFVNEVARETGTSDTYVDIRAYFQDKGFETAEGIVGYFFDIALQNEFTDLELAIAYDILSARGTSQFDIAGADAEARLRQLVATVMSFPGFQHQ